MATYPIDIEPAQIVRWLMAEQKATPSLFQFDARRATEVHKLPPGPKYCLGDSERKDLSEVDTIATLDIRPAHAAEGWTLTITVEDETGPRAINQRDTETTIDIETFYHQFMRPGRGVASASADVQDVAAERHLRELLDAIIVDRHPSPKKARHLSHGEHRARE